MRTVTVILFIGLLLIGCKDFLDVQPESIATPDEFFTESSSAQSSVDAIYSHLGGDGVYARDMWRLHALFSDNGFENGLDPALQRLSTFTVTADNALVHDIWTGLYKAINTCNFAISGIPVSPISEAEQTPLIAEARFFRGLFYFELVRCFGGVPVITEPSLSVTDEFKISRDSIETVYALIESDFIFARENLPESTLNGRPNTFVASAYLAKVYVETGQLTLAFQLTRSVILSDAFALQPDLELNFQVGNKVNSEVMLAAPLSVQSQGNVNTRSLPPQLNGRSFELPTDSLVSVYSDTDKRKAVSIIESVVNPDSTVAGIEPHMSKYWDETAEPAGGPTAVNYPILRYADILLLHAEIVSTLSNGPTTEAYFVANLVRERAGLPGLSGLNLGAFRVALLEERRRELAWEGYRWYDLKRFGALKESVEASKPGVEVREEHNLLPIPRFEIELNPLLEQNPGY